MLRTRALGINLVPSFCIKSRTLRKISRIEEPTKPLRPYRPCVDPVYEAPSTETRYKLYTLAGTFTGSWTSSQS